MNIVEPFWSVSPIESIKSIDITHRRGGPGNTVLDTVQPFRRSQSRKLQYFVLGTGIWEFFLVQLP